MELETATTQELQTEIRRLEQQHGILDSDPCSLARMPELFKTKIPPVELLRARLAAMQTWG